MWPSGVVFHQRIRRKNMSKSITISPYDFFYGSKHRGHRSTLPSSWIGICTYSAVEYCCLHVSCGLANVVSFPCYSCHFHVVSVFYRSKHRGHGCPLQSSWIGVCNNSAAWQQWFLFLVILVISIWYQAYYRKTARELARLIGIQKAPILHHLSETIAGAAPIRCFNQETRFFEKNMDLVDDYSCVAFHNSAAMEWLCVRINFSFSVAFFFLLVILLNIPRSAIDPSLARLAATYGLSLNVLQAWVIWNVCNVENKMISVERILQFTNLPSEAPLIIKTCRPSPEWPFQGTIQIQNLHLRYGPGLPCVLKGISCTFAAKKKIGIVGRTGSGKSTLIQALFRVVEPSEGRILIDGLDISKIGLQDLRSKLSIIPQDPILFPGTGRRNHDILQKHSDQEIWEVQLNIF